MITAFVSLPFSIKFVGVETMGFISLFWLVIGYAGILDLGLSRTLTIFVSNYLTENKLSKIASLFWSSIVITSLISLLFSIFFFIVINIFFKENKSEYLKIVNENKIIISLFVPFVIATSISIGVLTSYKLFGIINNVKILFGIVMTLAPIISYKFHLGIIGIILILLFSRIISFLIYFFYLLFKYKYLQKFNFSIEDLKILFGQGFWITISNIISPLIVNIDRFIIGKISGLGSVAYYSTTIDVLSKMNLVPATIISVLFPSFAEINEENNHEKERLFYKTWSIIFILIIPIVFLLIIFARQLINIWISVSFSNETYRLAQILLLGIFWNSVSQLPFSFLQSRSKSNITGKLHILEFCIFIPITIICITKFGVIGASISWSFRVFFDYLILSYFVNRELNKNHFRTIHFQFSILFTIICICTVFFNKYIYLTILIFIIYYLTCFKKMGIKKLVF